LIRKSWRIKVPPIDSAYCEISIDAKRRLDRVIVVVVVVVGPMFHELIGMQFLFVHTRTQSSVVSAASEAFMVRMQLVSL